MIASFLSKTLSRNGYLKNLVFLLEGDEPEETPGYKAPAQKTLGEIQQLDANDESLVRYKQMLLGGATAGKNVLLTQET